MMQMPPGLPAERPEKQDLGFILKIVSFCFPMVGIILYFLKRRSEPDAARQAAICAAFGVLAAVLINIFYSVVMKIIR